MNIKQAIARKRKLRQDIMGYVNTQLKEFEEETGLPVRDIELVFIDANQIGEEEKQVLSEVKIRVII